MPEPYAPFDLDTDPARFGLGSTTLTLDAGTVVARHPLVRGSDTATVFLHGAAGSWTTWTPLLDAAAERRADLGDTVLLDLPGWGSAPWTGGDATSVDELASLIAASVTGLGYDRVRIVGHSMGAFIALHLAATRPGIVESVILVSPTGHSVVEAVASARSGLRRIPGFVLLRGAMLALAPVDGFGRALIRGTGRIGLLRVFAAPLFRHPFAIGRHAVDAISTEMRPAAFIRATRAALGYVADESWARISCAVTASKGDRDVFTADYDLERLVAAVPHAVVTEIADCGHFANIERPFDVLALMDHGFRR